jgi:hypothetical protein
MEDNDFLCAKYLNRGRMGQIKGIFSKLFIDPLLGKFCKDRVYLPHPPRFLLGRLGEIEKP